MEQLLQTALSKKRFITFEQMYPSMAKLPSQEDTALAFAEVYTVVEYLHQKAGFPGIHKLIQAMTRGETDGRAVGETLGMSFDEFDKAWKSWLKGRKLKARPGLYSQKLRFRKGPRDQRDQRGKRAEPVEDDESGEIADPKARGFLRLGGMLRARKRLAAAAVEYEKAQTLLGAGHPILSGRLARTYLEMGELDKAIAAAEPVRELYPDLPSISVTLGSAYLKKGDPERAITHFLAAVRVSPFDPTVHCGLRDAYEQRKSPHKDRAAAACQLLR
jgi:tetratricopeptide (TPR) repeat protein